MKDRARQGEKPAGTPEDTPKPRATPTEAGRGPDNNTTEAGGNLVADELESLRQKAAERDEFLDLLQRVRADYANYQKRVLKEMDSLRRYAAQPVIADLLPVLDNLERALETSSGGDNSAGLVDGVRMVHQQLLSALARHGVQPIPAAGLPFDPEMHEALMEQPSPDKPPRTVLQELQRGYRLHDRVIRPARVVVSAARDSAAAEEQV